MPVSTSLHSAFAASEHESDFDIKWDRLPLSSSAVDDPSATQVIWRLMTLAVLDNVAEFPAVDTGHGLISLGPIRRRLHRIADGDSDAQRARGGLLATLEPRCPLVDRPSAYTNVLSQTSLLGGLTVGGIIGSGITQSVTFSGDAHFPWASIHAEFNKVSRREAFVLRDTKNVDNWRQGALLRFLRREWSAVPWAAHVAPVDDHFAHASTEEAGMVAFYDGERNGLRRVVTRVKPGRYLSKFYRGHLGDHDVRNYQALMAPVEMQWAISAEDIERVYTNGVGDSSGGGTMACASKPADTYSTHVHPTAIYGDSDLSVAYITYADGRTRARALVWKTEKKYGRVYGDVAVLGGLLRKEGYSQIAPGGWSGARVRRIANEAVAGTVVFPYVDAGTTASHGSSSFRLDTSGKWLILGDGSYKCASHSAGFAVINPPAYKTNCQCLACGRLMRPGSSLSVRLADPAGQLCLKCWDRYAGRRFTCEASGRNYINRPEGAAMVWCGTGTRLREQQWDRQAVMDLAYMCQIRCRYCCTATAPPVRLADGRLVSPQAFAERGVVVDGVNYERGTEPGERAATA